MFTRSIAAVFGALVLSMLIVSCSGAQPSAHTDLISDADIGTCTTLDLLKQSPQTFPRVDCDDAHDVEVVGIIDLDADTLPETAELEKLGQKKCPVVLREYVSDNADISALTVYWIRPSQTQWDDGVRKMPCIATSSVPWSGTL